MRSIVLVSILVIGIQSVVFAREVPQIISNSQAIDLISSDVGQRQWTVSYAEEVNQQKGKSWIKRNPVWFGAIVGFGVGTAIATKHLEDTNAFGKVLIGGGLGLLGGAFIGKIVAEY